MNRSRNMKMQIALLILGFVLTGLAVYTVATGATRTAENVIHLTAKKFRFTPEEITLKKGEPVAIKITSEDVRHGFSLPDFKVRANVKPGETAVVRFTPDKTGEFTFTCDVFCGAGHEDMSGTLRVVE